MSINTALMPAPRQQFFDANGVPLAGGFIYTYAAGTLTPQATYTDSTGNTPNTNPVVLDAGGFAGIWLSNANYKIIAQSALAVVQWTVDNVSSVSQTELQGANSFASLAVSGNSAIGGNETVSGTVTTAGLAVTGTAAISGALTAATAAIAGAESVGALLTAASLAVTGNETVGGTLGVTGATTLSGAVNIGAMTLAAYIASLIPTISAVAGTLIISDISTSGSWVIATFGATVGTRIRIAWGAGSGIATGGSIPLPSGFNSTNLIAHAAFGSLSTTAGNQLNNMAVSVTAGIVTITASDNSGHNFVPTAVWSGTAWITGY